MLSERARILLKTLVERYIADGQPVGSRTLSEHAGLELSPASIRAILAQLEGEGLIASPHTSAGRVPTQQGYRFFVDTLLTVQPPTAQKIAHLQTHMQPDTPQRMMHSAAHLLADLTQCAGVVVAQKHANAQFRHIEFLSLGTKRILVILVTPNGTVQNRILLTDHDYNDAELQQAANFLNQNYTGMSLSTIRRRLQHELTQLKSDISALMTAAILLGEHTPDDEECVVLGEHHLLGVRDLSADLSHLQQLFELFGRKTALLRLLDASNRANGVQIFIGTEAGLDALEGCSVISAPYQVDGEVIGTLGVIGPTRMAYERVIPIVDITARLLGNTLSHPTPAIVKTK